MRSTAIAELIKLAEQTELGDDIGLDVLGQCVLVCTLLDPDTTLDLKRQAAKRLASAAQPRQLVHRSRAK